MPEFMTKFYDIVGRHGWLLLLAAGLFEIMWALSLKLSEGYSKLWPTLATIPLALISTGLLAMAMRSIAMGTAYAIWTGIGAIGTVLLGILFYQEEASPMRLLCICLILAGMIGLKLTYITPSTGS